MTGSLRMIGFNFPTISTSMVRVLVSHTRTDCFQERYYTLRAIESWVGNIEEATAWVIRAPRPVPANIEHLFLYNQSNSDRSVRVSWVPDLRRPWGQERPLWRLSSTKDSLLRTLMQRMVIMLYNNADYNCFQFLTTASCFESAVIWLPISKLSGVLLHCCNKSEEPSRANE
jgi:hypothetical protein